MKKVKLYTDGACKGNPGRGGWAFILRYPVSGVELEHYGSEAHTTNNRMELTAVIKGLERLKEKCHVTLYSDSTYVTLGISKWMAGWKKNDWKKTKNVDLWKRIDELLKDHEIETVHVRGHSGHAENERCDMLASNAC